jgi:RIO-like serine/threonine protein kinase
VNTKINKLLTDFRQNAWTVHIDRDLYSEHDVANVLKRFMRTLDEPILQDGLRDKWMKASTIENQADKLNRSVWGTLHNGVVFANL